MDQLRGQFDDGSIVPVIVMHRPPGAVANAPVSPRFAIHNGEHLVRHPEDLDGTLFLTSQSGKRLRLIR